MTTYLPVDGVFLMRNLLERGATTLPPMALAGIGRSVSTEPVPKRAVTSLSGNAIGCHETDIDVHRLPLCHCATGLQGTAMTLHSDLQLFQGHRSSTRYVLELGSMLGIASQFRGIGTAMARPWVLMVLP